MLKNGKVNQLFILIINFTLLKNNKLSLSLNSLFKETFFSLKGKWFQAICIFLVAGIFQALIQSIPAVGGIFGFIISGPITVGYSIYSLNIVNNNSIHFNTKTKHFTMQLHASERKKFAPNVS